MLLILALFFIYLLLIFLYIKYIKNHFPDTRFINFENMGHGSMASLYPQKMVRRLEVIIDA